MANSLNASRELCVVCQLQPYDLICTCGDKFDFTCIHSHVEQIGIEFQFIQVDVGERLLKVEQAVEENNCTDARTIVENWKRKRIRDINDIAEAALNQIQERDDTHTDVAPLRVDYNTLCEATHRIVHEQLNSIVELQQKVQKKSDQLENLPKLLRDDMVLDSKIQSKLNPYSTTNEIEPITSTSMPTTVGNTQMSTEPIASSTANPTIHTEPIASSTSNSTIHTESIPSTTINRTIHTEPLVEKTANDLERSSMNENPENDEFDAGQTANIQRRNPTIISTNNDRFAGTICCHENQLIYNDYDEEARNGQLVLIPDITQPTSRENIEWIEPDTAINVDDDNWIQDITYSNKLAGYLLLNRSRLRFLRVGTYELEDYQSFPNRTMKRLTCNDTYIYLTSATGRNSQHGDEIIMINYDKEEKLCKTFRDIMPSRSNRATGPSVGEISDITFGANEQVMIAYRSSRRREVGVCIYNVRNDGNEWSCIKQLLLNECWHDDLSYTPRVDWCEKLNAFVLIEHMTSHLIMLDQAGQVTGECRFTHVENQRESPINLTISTNDWFCIRYESSINIHRINNRRT